MLAMLLGKRHVKRSPCMSHEQISKEPLFDFLQIVLFDNLSHSKSEAKRGPKVAGSCFNEMTHDMPIQGTTD